MTTDKMKAPDNQLYVLYNLKFLWCCPLQIYMYGGTMRSGHTSKELWALDMTTSLWERVETKKGICLPERGSSFTPSLCGPIHSMGHTATVQSNRMIVIFGHSPKYGYLNTVQEYHFGSKEWSVVRTSGYPGMVTNDFFSASSLGILLLFLSFQQLTPLNLVPLSGFFS